ncbi:MAG: hypothetical protein R3F48_02180 [Candidatus Zixiibacteriota bacterium]
MNAQTHTDIPTMKINQMAETPIQCDRPIMLASGPCMHNDKELRAADRITRSCFENVRFLNEHLKRYESFIDLPHLVENALYLAYTISVKPNPYFEASDLKRFLNSCGVETSESFSFEQNATPMPVFRAKNLAVNKMDTFCIACHQNLTILDIQSIAKRFDAFFSSLFGA